MRTTTVDGEWRYDCRKCSSDFEAHMENSAARYNRQVMPTAINSSAVRSRVMAGSREHRSYLETISEEEFGLTG